VRRRDVRKPLQEAPIGSIWELDVGGKGKFTAIVVVVSEFVRRTGNYPCLMLHANGPWTTYPGQRMNAAVTTAQWWRRIV
jgi:hypothetical protein